MECSRLWVFIKILFWEFLKNLQVQWKPHHTTSYFLTNHISNSQPSAFHYNSAVCVGNENSNIPHKTSRERRRNETQSNRNNPTKRIPVFDIKGKTEGCDSRGKGRIEFARKTSLSNTRRNKIYPFFSYKNILFFPKNTKCLPKFIIL